MGDYVEAMLTVVDRAGEPFISEPEENPLHRKAQTCANKNVAWLNIRKAFLRH